MSLEHLALSTNSALMNQLETLYMAVIVITSLSSQVVLQCASSSLCKVCRCVEAAAAYPAVLVNSCWSYILSGWGGWRWVEVGGGAAIVSLLTREKLNVEFKQLARGRKVRFEA